MHMGFAFGFFVNNTEIGYRMNSKFPWRRIWKGKKQLIYKFESGYHPFEIGSLVLTAQFFLILSFSPPFTAHNAFRNSSTEKNEKVIAARLLFGECWDYFMQRIPLYGMLQVDFWQHTKIKPLFLYNWERC